MQPGAAGQHDGAERAHEADGAAIGAADQIGKAPQDGGGGGAGDLDQQAGPEVGMGPAAIGAADGVRLAVLLRELGPAAAAALRVLQGDGAEDGVQAGAGVLGRAAGAAGEAEAAVHGGQEGGDVLPFRVGEGRPGGGGGEVGQGGEGDAVDEVGAGGEGGWEDGHGWGVRKDKLLF